MRWARRLQCSSVKREYVLAAQVQGCCETMPGFGGPTGSPLGSPSLENTAEGLFLLDPQLGEQSVHCISTPQLGATVPCTKRVASLGGGVGGGGAVLTGEPKGLSPLGILTYEFGRDTAIQTIAPSDLCEGHWCVTEAWTMAR